MNNFLIFLFRRPIPFRRREIGGAWAVGIERRGFTLVELMIAAGLFGMIMVGAISAYLICQKMWLVTTMQSQATMDATMALNRMVYGIGTNHGLRAASNLVVNNNFYGYRAPSATNYPLAADSINHELKDDGPADGSWRIEVKSFSPGVRWIDYNRKASNIVFWATPNVSSSRQLIANYVSGAGISTNKGGLSVNLSISNRHGRIFVTNSATTFIKLRNDMN